MSETIYIQGYVTIRNDKVTWDGKDLPVGSDLSANEFLKKLYQFLQLDYPKFFKMDELCKLAFVGSEFLLKDFSEKNTLQATDWAVVLSNASSTLETDRKHQQSISDNTNYFPSPSVFVYTLPNITIGEIAIRHGFKGENTFFVTEKYDIPFMFQYVQSSLTHDRAKEILTGWVEFNAKGFETFLYLAGKQRKGLAIEHNPENIASLYKTRFSV